MERGSGDSELIYWTEGEWIYRPTHLSGVRPTVCAVGRKRYVITDWNATVPSACQRYYDGDRFEVLEMVRASGNAPRNERILRRLMPVYKQHVMDELPDNVLYEVFRRLHPTDRILSASLVCKRWNRLAMASGLYTQLQLANISSEHIDCAKKFLEKISCSLRRLCVKGGFAVFLMLPEVLPKLDLFEAHFRDGSLIEEEDRGASCFSALAVRMPRLRCLSLIFGNCEVPAFRAPPFHSSVEINLQYLFRCLPYLKALQLAVADAHTICGITEFLNERPNLEELRIEGNIELGSLDLRDCGKSSGLKRISLRRVTMGRVRGFSFLQPQLRHLTFLELISRVACQKLDALKGLHQLSHFHLKWFFEMQRSEFQSLFESTSDSSQFPYTLHHLSIFLPWEANVDDVKQICTSCPHLRSLRCEHSQYAFKMEEKIVECIAESLKELRFLGVHSLCDMASLLSISSTYSPENDLFHLISVVATINTCEDKELTLLLFRRWPVLLIYDGRMFVPSPGRRGRVDAQEESRRIDEILTHEEGYCCVRDWRSFW